MPDFKSVLPYLGVDEVKPIPSLLKSLLAETIGTMFLVLVGCGSCYNHNGDFVRIALAFGVTVATMAASIGHISGCHINPAITVGLICGSKIGLIKGFLYIVVQCIGAIIGSGLTWGFMPANETKVPGQTVLGKGVSMGQGFAIEFFITFVLVLVVYAVAADEENAANVKGSAPLAIGLSITTCHLLAIPLTGSSMNPARSFGPAVVGAADTLWNQHWVYWFGPIFGGIAAALVYQLAFKAEPKKTEYSPPAHQME